MTVRNIRVEVIVPKERREALRDTSVACQRMHNRLWQIWLCHHSNHGSAAKLRGNIDAYNRWQENKQGDKPSWPCNVVEEPLTKSADSRSFYRIISAEFQQVNACTRGLLTNAWQSLLRKRKAANGNLDGWVSILFGNESLPSFTRPQPIPFDKDNAKLSRDENGTVLELRLDRDIHTRKSTVDRLPVLLNKRKSRKARVIVDRILSGEYAWKGSSLKIDKGKWFALLAYEMPLRERVGLDPNKVLFVRPGYRSPWRVRIEGESWRFGGDGSHVRHYRSHLINERRSRQQHYRYAGSAQKGHGFNRAASVWTKLSSHWKDFTKRYNHEISKQVVNLAVSRGCGRIVYLQPKEKERDGRFLTVAGNTEWSKSGWDYFQFGTFLAYKCQEEGLEYGKKPKTKTKKSTTKTAAGSVRGVRKANEPKRKERSGGSVSGLR